MATQVQPQKQCPRCAASIPAEAAACPNCGLVLQAGVAYFEPTQAASGPRVEGEAAGQPYERRSISCLPMDLERVARAEAVDGWSLTDTTADPAVPGNIIANFRRPVRAAARPTETQSPAGTTRAAKAKSGTKRGQTRSGAPRPSLGAGPDPTPTAFNVLKVLLVVGAIAFLADNFGIAGFVLGLIFVPGLVRSLLASGKGARRKP